MGGFTSDRKAIVEHLRRELVGPAPDGRPLDCSQPLNFGEIAQAWGPWYQQDSGEEILTRDSPCKRYGIGVLYPLKSEQESDTSVEVPGLGTGDTDDQGSRKAQELLTASAPQDLDEIAKRSSQDSTQPDADDFDISAANAYKPSSMGVSFLAELPPETNLIVEVSGGRYQERGVKAGTSHLRWWFRSPVSLHAGFPSDKLCDPSEILLKSDPQPATDDAEPDLRVEVFSRPHGGTRLRLITVCLVNRRRSVPFPIDPYCLFQAHMRVSVLARDGGEYILPYPDALSQLGDSVGEARQHVDEEAQSLALLYRGAKTFATGHGCAANWGISTSSSDEGFDKTILVDVLDPAPERTRVYWVSAECLPIVETPSITPELTRRDGTAVTVSMAPLAGLQPGDDGLAALSEVIAMYEHWVAEKEQDISRLDLQYRSAATQHMAQCRRCVVRMRTGLEYLRTNPLAQRAFQLANHAMLLQQLHSRRESRITRYNETLARYVFDEPYVEPDPFKTTGERGAWRPFQIAFLLMALRSAVDGTAPDRETVELIWFPTGGGKTEAYLGLSAFAIFMRRLVARNDVGVHVLMRYTLRLLTAQQFQRASGLICAMEVLRRQYQHELGTGEFSIGIWLGGSTTPNTRQEALAVLRALNSDSRFAENQLLVTRCPWCGAQLGPVDSAGPTSESTGQKRSKFAKTKQRTPGYSQQGDTVRFSCPDTSCTFSRGLPVYVIDEDIYEVKPTLVIGTVDKFAMLAWRPAARALFGIGLDGKRICSPPGLIIQDELHLISGPLGSMVGLYEGMIEELCTDVLQEGKAIRPKIVSSTATIRRYEAQVKALYARSDVALFPPPGLDASDSFFARYARTTGGRLMHGRLYVGVHAPGLGSLQTAQVRTFSALLQAPLSLGHDQRDPWWTLLAFFNSLRELGTTVTLFQSDIPDYLRTMRNRAGIDYKNVRRLSRIRELTGRLRSDEVPEAISALEMPYREHDDRAVDVCLASNIIEVGVDIDRLSLMTVVGQPKSTSQYIQVTGRVGRRWKERPGIVVTIYGASKPRDRSHFERFRTYHERLYAQVEPTSVTPFSPPVLDRALHAALVAFARQQGPKSVADSPYPYPADLVNQWIAFMQRRVAVVDNDELPVFERVAARRAGQWRMWERLSWESRTDDPNTPLLRVAGAYANSEQRVVSWATPQSMRNVDAECEAIITSLYFREGVTDGAE